MSKKKNNLTSLTSFDKFILNHVPKFFEILGWTALLGVLQYVAGTTNNWAVWLIYGVSLIALNYYIQVYVYSNIPAKLRSKKGSISLVLGMVFAISIWFLLNKVLDELAKSSVN